MLSKQGVYQAWEGAWDSYKAYQEYSLAFSTIERLAELTLLGSMRSQALLLFYRFEPRSKSGRLGCLKPEAAELLDVSATAQSREEALLGKTKVFKFNS
jgi:hypothetical protein